MLKFNPAIAEVTVIIPVASVHVGCVTVTVGAAGVGGCAFIVATVAEETHPAAFLAVTKYEPGATPVNTPVLFV
jgi:hypothetical protein